MRRDVELVNWINIALMLAAAALACLLPFEVLLLSYAVLGPLHYLTQISWLRDRDFFTVGRFDWIPLVVLAGAGFLSAETRWLPWDGAYFAALGTGVVAAFVGRPLPKLASIGLLGLLATPVHRWMPAAIFFTVLLVTVVHVYVFTGLFILVGSLRSRSRSGFLSLVVFVACGAALLFVHPSAAAYAVSVETRRNLVDFEPLIYAMTTLVPGGRAWDGLVAVGRFLAFAYTYHYLNWFSKTGIIRWHEMSRTRMATIGIVYLGCLAVYGYDYHLGIMVLYFLSLTHVFLEFPLDARTAVEAATRILRPTRSVARQKGLSIPALTP